MHAWEVLELIYHFSHHSLFMFFKIGDGLRELLLPHSANRS